VWNALLKFAQLTDRDAGDAVKPDTAPIVFVEELPGAFGLFTKGRPEVISLATDLIGKFEVNPRDGELMQTIEATTLRDLRVRAGRGLLAGVILELVGEGLETAQELDGDGLALAGELFAPRGEILHGVGDLALPDPADPRAERVGPWRATRQRLGG
jgi:hypothetical protein